MDHLQKISPRKVVVCLSLGLVLSSILGCNNSAKEVALENTIALFAANGVVLTPELREEIDRASFGIHTFRHMEDAYALLRKRGEELNIACLAIKEVSNNAEMQKDIVDFKNRATALQIIAFHNHWPIDDKYRLHKTDLGC